MAATPSDFQHPETPNNFREFYILYFNDSKRLNAKLDTLDKSQAEDRETFEAIMDRLEDSLAKHASCLDSLDYRLKVNEGATKELAGDLKTLNAKTNWMGGINATLTSALGAIVALFK